MRKSKFLYGLAILAIAAVAAGNVNINSQTNVMSDLALANVEALASDVEGGSGGSLVYNIEEGNCSVTLSGQAGIKGTVLGVNYTIPASGSITLTFNDVKILCSSGGKYACTQKTCADFWK